MCPKCWTHFGHIIFNAKIEQMCPKFGHIMDIFLGTFGVWTCFGQIMDIFLTHLGLDTLWTDYGHFSKISVQNVSIHTL